MSFLKITDPVKRDQIVKEYLETKKKIRDSQLAEKTGEIELQTGLSKFFKPITETQREAATKIAEELKPIKEGIEQLPQRLPQQQLIPKEEEKEEEEEVLTILDRQYKALKAQYGKETDTTFGIKRKGINYYIGDKPVDYDGDNIWIGAERYEPTDGLWELIMSKYPDGDKYTNDDGRNYEKILKDSNVIFINDNPANKPKSSGGIKYDKFIRHVYKEIKEERKKTGKGIVIIPSDPKALLERLDLLMASKEAGNTGVRNELVSICDELKRQGVLNSDSYKTFMTIL